jgi:hypothetical protein
VEKPRRTLETLEVTGERHHPEARGVVAPVSLQAFEDVDSPGDGFDPYVKASSHGRTSPSKKIHSGF